MSAPKATRGAANGSQIGFQMTQIALQLPPSEIPPVSTRRVECCADLP